MRETRDAVDTLTRSVVRERRRYAHEQRKAARLKRRAGKKSQRQRRRETRQQQRTYESDLMRSKLEALRAVNEASKGVAASRAGFFKRNGALTRVCRWKGPHDSVWCIFHGNRRVLLIPIPGSHRMRGEPLQLGSDARIYRVGRTKVYEANLLHRANAGEILTLEDRLDNMM